MVWVVVKWWQPLAHIENHMQLSSSCSGTLDQSLVSYNSFFFHNPLYFKDKNFAPFSSQQPTVHKCVQSKHILEEQIFLTGAFE